MRLFLRYLRNACKVIRLIALLFAEPGSGVFPKGGYSHGMHLFEAIPENQ